MGGGGRGGGGMADISARHWERAGRGHKRCEYPFAGGLGKVCRPVRAYGPDAPDHPHPEQWLRARWSIWLSAEAKAGRLRR